jgi:hypothetical protein
MAAPPLSPLPRLLDISSSSSLGTGMGGGGRLQSWGGRRRSAGATPTYRERRRELARLPASAPIPDVGEGWTTPRDQRSSLQGLRALASASVLREDVYRSMVAVTQGRAPLIDEASLHNLSVSAIQSAVADDRPRRHSRGSTRARGGTPRKHHPTVGSRALRGGQSAVLKSVCTRDQVSSAVDQQRKLGNEIDVLAQDLERTIAELSAVRGRYRCVRCACARALILGWIVRGRAKLRAWQEGEGVEGVAAASWSATCGRKASHVSSLRHSQLARQEVALSSTTLMGELERLCAAAEKRPGRGGGAVVDRERAAAAKELSCLLLGAGRSAALNRAAVAGFEGGRATAALVMMLSSRSEVVQVGVSFQLLLVVVLLMLLLLCCVGFDFAVLAGTLTDLVLW